MEYSQKRNIHCKEIFAVLLECVVHGYISVDLGEANKLPFGSPEGLVQVKRTLGGESAASIGQISWKPDVAG
jgi:hypothetical protein